jgi:hypothetical protein
VIAVGITMSRVVVSIGAPQRERRHLAHVTSRCGTRSIDT